jgi:hypothetical protein
MPSSASSASGSWSSGGARTRSSKPAAGVLDERLEHVVAVAAEGDAVVDAPEHARDVADRLLDAEADVVGPQDVGVGALVGGRHHERRARARGGLEEDDRDAAAGEPLRALAAALSLARVGGCVEQQLHLLGRVRAHRDEAAPAECRGHR